ncbi:hypothetical protein [Streptomyces justiciae]|uniref:Uncharacterized protein n=1 Tax=Streptomyces justiciae TaxID=2780140 RepID=A0ABU3M0R1_9ACTN|nr:hypothetical protein [Streptomyces justiciae]MDT7845072.1 hypothetical protein [Streptomyces justiciae]
MAEEPITARLHTRIERDFPEPGAAKGIEGALRVLAGELEGSRQDTERLLAAAVLIADGDVDRFRSAVRLGRQDWRDLLVSGGVADGDWPSVLDRELGRSR